MRALLVGLLVVFGGSGCGRRAADPAATRSHPAEPPATPAAKPPEAGPPPPAAPVVRAAGATIPGWGKVVDPDGDCVVREYPTWLSITVPSSAHDINPNNEKSNAPLVVRPVDGDFRVVVRVTGEFLPTAPSTSRVSQAFHGAGLVLWQDEKNLLVLARNCWTAAGGKGLCYPPQFELFEDKQPKHTNPPVVAASVFQGSSTALYLERRGDVVRGAFSNDAKTWEGWRQTTVHLPRAVKLGIAVVNTAAEPFVVAFDGFKLLGE